MNLNQLRRYFRKLTTGNHFSRCRTWGIKVMCSGPLDLGAPWLLGWEGRCYVVCPNSQKGRISFLSGLLISNPLDDWKERSMKLIIIIFLCDPSSRLNMELCSGFLWLPPLLHHFLPSQHSFLFSEIVPMTLDDQTISNESYFGHWKSKELSYLRVWSDDTVSHMFMLGFSLLSLCLLTSLTFITV